MEPTIGIAAAAYWLPEQDRMIGEIFAAEDVPDTGLPWPEAERDLGIESVRFAAPDDLPSAMAVEAARRALVLSGLDPLDLDLVLGCTSIPEDYPAPAWSAAGIVQQELGAAQAVATALNTGGAASVGVALKIACALLAARADWQAALLFSAEKVPESNHGYYPLTVTSDVASALVLRKGHPQRSLLAVEALTVGALHDVWTVPGLPNRSPADASPDRHLFMRSDPRRFNERVAPINRQMLGRVMTAALERSGVKLEDIACFVYPTLSARDQQGFREAFRIPPEKLLTDGLARHGHLQESDMVVNYVDALEEGRIRSGDLVMLVTGGPGCTWSAAVIRE